jgi:hypothetical protein
VRETAQNRLSSCILPMALGLSFSAPTPGQDRRKSLFLKAATEVSDLVACRREANANVRKTTRNADTGRIDGISSVRYCPASWRGSSTAASLTAFKPRRAAGAIRARTSAACSGCNMPCTSAARYAARYGARPSPSRYISSIEPPAENTSDGTSRARDTARLKQRHEVELRRG